MSDKDHDGVWLHSLGRLGWPLGSGFHSNGVHWTALQSCRYPEYCTFSIRTTPYQRTYTPNRLCSRLPSTCHQGATKGPSAWPEPRQVSSSTAPGPRGPVRFGPRSKRRGRRRVQSRPVWSWGKMEMAEPSSPRQASKSYAISRAQPLQTRIPPSVPAGSRGAVANDAVGRPSSAGSRRQIRLPRVSRGLKWREWPEELGPQRCRPRG